MSYADIKYTIEKFATLVVVGAKNTIKMKSTSYAQPELCTVFKNLREAAAKGSSTEVIGTASSKNSTKNPPDGPKATEAASHTERTPHKPE